MQHACMCCRLHQSASQQTHHYRNQQQVCWPGELFRGAFCVTAPCDGRCNHTAPVGPASEPFALTQARSGRLLQTSCFRGVFSLLLLFCLVFAQRLPRLGHADYSVRTGTREKPCLSPGLRTADGSATGVRSCRTSWATEAYLSYVLPL